MKKLKKYILAIAMCLCLMFTSLTGCALIVPDNSKALEAKAISVGETVLSKQEVIDLWYSFYSQNVNVFYYYSEDQIIEIFYKNIVLKYATIQETQKLIDAGKIVYTAGDDAQVWLSVLESISSSVDTIEKSLYTQQGTEEDKLPKHLQSESSSSSNSDVKSYLYEEYTFKGMEDYQCKYTPANNKGEALGSTKIGADIEDESVKKIQTLLATYLYKDMVESDEELEFTNWADLGTKLNNTNYFTNIDKKDNRAKAFDMYVGKLMLSAKADGERLNKDQAIQKQIKELYIAYYETYLQNMYSSYINSLVDVNEQGNQYYTLSDSAIVNRYLNLLGSAIQKYQLEENYIAVVEAESDNALLLYRFNGEYYYFTVQHLLVSFDEDITDALAGLYGNSSNASEDQYEIYQTIRDNFYSQIGETGLTSWEEYKNATYRDENGYDVYTYKIEDVTKFVYFDKDWTTPEYEDEIEDDQKENGYYYLNADEKVYLTVEQFNDCKKATVSLQIVLDEFNTTYNTTLSILNEYVDPSQDINEQTIDDIHNVLDVNPNIKYVISKDLIKLYIDGIRSNNAKVKKEVEHKVYTNLFMQHAFKYSADSASLGTELSDYVGMIISGRDDNHTVGGGTYVNEFTDKARELAKHQIEAMNATESYSPLLNEDSYAISDYGIHIMVVNDVYKVDKSAPITGDDISSEKIYGTKDSPLTQDQINANIAEAVAKMKTIYVSSSSSQTLYQYMYELVRDELVGDNGTIYTKERNRLYKEYITAGENGESKADMSGKMTYDELMDAIS